MKWLFFLLSAFPLALFGQDLFLIHLQDKAGSQYDPYAELDDKAIARRLREGRDLCDISDWPVSIAYEEAITATGADLRYSLRWLNAISVLADPQQLQLIRSLSFVKEVELLGQMELSATSNMLPPLSPSVEKLLRNQRDQMQLDFFVEEGLSGRGVRIAIFDAGFTAVNTDPGFAHLFEKGQILEVRDFYQADRNIYAHSRHGTSVLGCIAGKYGSELIGAAPNAQFLLARTEHSIFERAVEEDHWLAAMEWADRKGADIISSSLGYTNKRYKYRDMDGKTAPVSRAARLAAEKGILVINANGNDGDGKWHYLNAPADVPEVLSIGGTEAELPVHISFGSYGPNALGERKPNLSAPAHVASLNGLQDLGETYGTSFSTPLVAGFAACVKERFPDLPLQALFRRLESSGHLYPYYDYAHGYGVPQASKALQTTVHHYENKPSFELQLEGNKLIVSLLKKGDKPQSPALRILHYHYEHPDRSHLIEYHFRVLRPQSAAYSFRLPDPVDYPGRKGILRIWLNGYLSEMEW